jgi:hypothetical protein
MSQWSCPRCGNTDIRTAAMIYAQGTSTKTTTRASVGVGFLGRSAGVGTTSGASNTVKMTALAAQYAPPNVDRDSLQVAYVLGILGILFGLTFIMDWSTVVWALLCMGASWWLLRKWIPKETKRIQAVLDRYDRTVVCMRCGSAFDVGAVEGSPATPAKQRQARLSE